MLYDESLKALEDEQDKVNTNDLLKSLLTPPHKEMSESIPYYLDRNPPSNNDQNAAFNEMLMRNVFPTKEVSPKEEIPAEEIQNQVIQDKLSSPKLLDNKNKPSRDLKENSQSDAVVEKNEDKPDSFKTEKTDENVDLTVSELRKRMEIAKQNTNVLMQRLHDYSLINAATGGNNIPTDDIKLNIAQQQQDVGNFEALLNSKRKEEESNVSMSKALMELDNEKALNKSDSAISESGRTIIRKMAKESGMNLEIPDGVPFSQLKLMFPSIEKYLQAKETADTRKEMAAENRLTREMALGEQRQKFDDRRFDQANKLIQSEISGNRSAFGRNANIVRSSQALEQLIAGYNNLNDLDSRQIQEIAKGLDAMLSAGAATITGTQKLIPHTASGDLAKISEYINGIPKGADQGKFIKRMMDTIQREKLQASKNILGAQQKLLASYQDLKQRYPERWEAMMDINEIPSDLKDKSKQDEIDKQIQSTHETKKINNGLVRVKSPDGKVYELDANKAEQLINKYNYTRM